MEEHSITYNFDELEYRTPSGAVIDFSGTAVLAVADDGDGYAVVGIDYLKLDGYMKEDGTWIDIASPASQARIERVLTDIGDVALREFRQRYSDGHIEDDARDEQVYLARQRYMYDDFSW